ncbi:MAG: Lrp/AsnC family transcriptional regulator [Alphaproteobacteria bacterium]|nr:Lrp/AsnC family transcriptional regulator [Alphaproteobacteria bacterium]
MKPVKLDRTDMRILRELQRDGSITNVALSKKAGISPPPCLRRVRALEEAGYIKGYYADIAADKMGFGITVFTLVSLANHSESDIAHFSKLLESWPQVRESYQMTGDTDYLLKVVAEDWEAFQKFVTTQLSSASNVAHVKSMPAMRRVKHAPGVPIEEREERVIGG